MARLTVNNQPVQYRLEDDTPLLWALRDGANLTGTKYGCGTGECGACMVIVDGQAMPSCTLLLGEVDHILTDDACRDPRFLFEGAFHMPILQHSLRSRLAVRTNGAVMSGKRAGQSRPAPAAGRIDHYFPSL